MTTNACLLESNVKVLMSFFASWLLQNLGAPLACSQQQFTFYSNTRPLNLWSVSIRNLIFSTLNMNSSVVQVDGWDTNVFKLCADYTQSRVYSYPLLLTTLSKKHKTMNCATCTRLVVTLISSVKRWLLHSMFDIQVDLSLVFFRGFQRHILIKYHVNCVNLAF